MAWEELSPLSLWVNIGGEMRLLKWQLAPQARVDRSWPAVIKSAKADRGVMSEADRGVVSEADRGVG